MSSIDRLAGERHQTARSALAALGEQRRENVRLRVDCARSRHLATIYDSPDGLVYASMVGPHAHGDRDFVDVAHHAQRRGTEYSDMLEVGTDDADDAMPAWCECGPRTLSRAELVAAVAARKHRLRA